MVKVAFSGKVCSGKSTAARMVAELVKNKLSQDVVILSFAAKIKELAAELFGMKTKNRKLLQDIGTKMREINKDVWLDHLINQTKQCRKRSHR